MFGITIISKSRLDSLNPAVKRGKHLDSSKKYIEGYIRGYKDAELDCIKRNYSPNQIRAAFGLDPFPVESKEWKRINQLFEEATAMRKDV